MCNASRDLSVAGRAHCGFPLPLREMSCSQYAAWARVPGAPAHTDKDTAVRSQARNTSPVAVCMPGSADRSAANWPTRLTMDPACLGLCTEEPRIRPCERACVGRALSKQSVHPRTMLLGLHARQMRPGHFSNKCIIVGFVDFISYLSTPFISVVDRPSEYSLTCSSHLHRHEQPHLRYIAFRPSFGTTPLCLLNPTCHSPFCIHPASLARALPRHIHFAFLLFW